MNDPCDSTGGGQHPAARMHGSDPPGTPKHAVAVMCGAVLWSVVPIMSAVPECGCR